MYISCIMYFIYIVEIFTYRMYMYIHITFTGFQVSRYPNSSKHMLHTYTYSIYIYICNIMCVYIYIYIHRYYVYRYIHIKLFIYQICIHIYIYTCGTFCTGLKPQINSFEIQREDSGLALSSPTEMPMVS